MLTEQEINESSGILLEIVKSPFKNALWHRFTKIFLKIPFLPSSFKSHLKYSAEKRNPEKIKGYLNKIHSLIRGFAETAGLDFIKSQIPHRRKTLLSNWHLSFSISSRDSSHEAIRNITVSVVTNNSARFLCDFLNSLKNQNYPTQKISVVFVDHESKDETIKIVKDFIADSSSIFASIMLIKYLNHGSGAGHDFVIQQSSDDFILISNVAILFHKDSIKRLLAAAALDQDDVASWEPRQCPYEQPKYYDPVTLETSWSSHTCILLRRSAYLRVGGYENSFLIHREDVELSYRFRGSKYRLRYLPQVTITHLADPERLEANSRIDDGMISSNILLRYRYAGEKTGQLGEAILKEKLGRESKGGHQEAVSRELERIKKHRKYFSKFRRPEKLTSFPFKEIDCYDIERIGHNVKLDSSVPINEYPLVTIITRTHGSNIGILAESITSVINQSYRNIEHLIIEDKTDFAKDLVAAVKNGYGVNISYFKCVDYKGAGRSLAGNEGLARAKGRFIMFLDYDDLLFSDHVELLVRKLLEQRNIVAAYSLAWSVPAFYSASGNYREGAPSTILTMPYRRENFLKGNFIPIQAIIFKRELYEKYGGFDPSIDHYEDWNLWARYAAAGPFELVPKVTSLYHIPGDPEFISQRDEDMAIAYKEVHRKTFGGSTK